MLKSFVKKEPQSGTTSHSLLRVAQLAALKSCPRQEWSKSRMRFLAGSFEHASPPAQHHSERSNAGMKPGWSQKHARVKMNLKIFTTVRTAKWNSLSEPCAQA